MTDETVNVHFGDEPIAEAPAPKGQYYSTIKGRRILVKHVNEAQSMVLGGLFRQTEGASGIGEVLAILGKIMRLVEALIPNRADIDWLEGMIIDGDIKVEDFATIFVTVEAAEKKKRVPRRGQ